MSRILLISSNLACEPYPVYPLGLASITAALKVKGHEVVQFDFLASDRSHEKLREILTEFTPQFVGMSVRNIDNVDSFSSHNRWYLPNDRATVGIVRQMTEAPIIVGGAGYSLLPNETLRYLEADYGVVGEGEQAICTLIRRLEQGDVPPKVIVPDEGLLGGTSIPTPVRDERLIAYYKGQSAIGIQSKRGCVHSCSYCTYPNLEGHKLRCREPGVVVDEMEELHRSYGINRFFFTDSVFNDPSDRYMSLVEELIQRELPVAWSGFFCPEHLGRQTLRLLKRAGLESVEVGSDGATDETIAALRKPFDFGDILAFQNECQQEEIPAVHYFVFGSPGETESTLRKGLKNLDHLNGCVIFGFSGIRLFPKTELYERAISEGIIQSDESLLEPVYYFSPLIDREEMERAVKVAFRGHRHRIFPPTDAQIKLKILRRLGYTGALWDKLLTFAPTTAPRKELH